MEVDNDSYLYVLQCDIIYIFTLNLRFYIKYNLR